MVYVDDIGTFGSRRTIHAAGENLKDMEKQKGFTFGIGNGKTQYMIIKGKRRTKKEEEQEIEIELKKGRVQETNKYRYLGNWIGVSGTAECQIEEIEKRVPAMITQMIKLASEEKLGRFSTAARLMLYEKTIVPAMTYGLDCWRLEKKDKEKLERIQGMALRRILALPSTTPYWAMLKETGIWTMEGVVAYQRLMLLENMLKSNKNRLGRRVIESQKEENWGWYQETERIARSMGIEGLLEKLKTLKKSAWKKEIKEKIRQKMEREAEEIGKEMKKMRHQRGQRYERKKYLNEMGSRESSETIRRRLEMLDIGNNFGKKRVCRCGEKEGTEHLIDCLKEERKKEVKVQWLEETEEIWKIRKVNEWLGSYLEERERRKCREEEEEK